MLSSDFLSNFKRTTESIWSKREINPVAYGFQFQCGTRWNPELTEEKIAEYQKAISGASDSTLQQIRYLRESVFLKSWTPEEFRRRYAR